jgi:hypothetical protein
LTAHLNADVEARPVQLVSETFHTTEDQHLTVEETRDPIVEVQKIEALDASGEKEGLDF